MKRSLTKGLTILTCIISAGLLSLCVAERSQGDVCDVLESLAAIELDYLDMTQAAQYQLPLTSYAFAHPGIIAALSESIPEAMENSRFRIESLVYHSFDLLSSGAGGFGPPLSGTGQDIPFHSPESLTAWMSVNQVKVDKMEEWMKLPYTFKRAIIENLISIKEAIFVFDQFAAPVRSYLREAGAREPEVPDPDPARKDPPADPEGNTEK